MKNSGKKAFTLVELLVGMIMMLLVLGGVVATLRSGLDLFFKSEANGKVTNGVRFTVDTFDRVISPLLANATEVEILSKNSDIPAMAELQTNDHYIYLSGDQVMHRTNTKDEPLEGSEYIKSISFAMTKTSKDVAEDWTLSVDIAGEVPTYTAAKVAVSMDKMLMSVQKKSGGTGTSDGDYYKGPVLHFVAQSDKINFSIILGNLGIYDARTGGNNCNKQAIVLNNKDSLWISYDVHPSVDPGFDWEDASIHEWYISGAIDAPETIVSNDPSSATTEYKEAHRWRLLGNDGHLAMYDVGQNPNPFEVLVSKNDNSVAKYTTRGFEVKQAMSSNGKTLYVLIKKNNKESSGNWGSVYGVLWCKVTPAIRNKSTGEIIYGNPQWSDWVRLASQKASTLLGRWVSALRGTEENGDFFKTTIGESGNSDYKYLADGTAYMSIKVGDENAGTATAAKGQVDLLDAVSSIDKESNGKSYTTLTNYSIIIDAKIDKGNGYGVLLNGAAKGSGSRDYSDNGYVLQVDKAIDALPIRVFGKSYQAAYYMATDGNNDESAYYVGTRLYESNNENGSNYISGAPGGATTAVYGPGYMKNSLFHYSTPNSNRGNSYPWNERKRVIITVLEYYLNDHPEAPKYIIRMRYLKDYDNAAQENKKDPWQIGPDYYYSEPVWWGDYVGDKPEITVLPEGYYCDKHNTRKWGQYTDSYPDGCSWSQGCYYKYYSQRNKYQYNVNNYDSPKSDNNVFSLGTSKPSDSFASHYIMRTRYDNNSGTYYCSAFKALDMDVRTAINHSGFENPATGAQFNSSTQTTIRNYANNLFATVSRDRYLALRIWDHKQGSAAGTSTTVQFFNIDYAPGFSKAELKAILPANAKLYEVTETGQEAKDSTEPLHYKLNQDLFEHSSKAALSDGDGNDKDNTKRVIGVMQIQHMKANCSCPLEKYK